MIHFDCDYMAGAHPQVLDAIVACNAEQTSGYGNDPYQEHARALIREACGLPDAGVWFLVGGTQTNATVIDGLLRGTDGVVCAESGHINVHEAGAIEIFGHKVIALPQHEGKLSAADLLDYLHEFYADDSFSHMVAPGAVYISFSTEFGTLYSLDELREISQVCHDYRLPLYLDGARLGHALAASKDVTLRDIAQLTDVFYIGGTKMGALFGEAVVCTNPELLPRFFTLMKAHGAVLAKGKFLGAQFSALFTDDLYLSIGRHTVRLAMRLRDILRNHGCSTFIDSPTNQQFFIMQNAMIDALLPHASFEYWGARGAVESKVRFVTSWETTDADLDELERLLDGIH